MRFDHDLVLSHVCGLIRQGVDAHGHFTVQPDVAVDVVVSSMEMLGDKLGLGSNSVDVEKVKVELKKRLGVVNEEADSRTAENRRAELAMVRAVRAYRS